MTLSFCFYFFARITVVHALVPSTRKCKEGKKEREIDSDDEHRQNIPQLPVFSYDYSYCSTERYLATIIASVTNIINPRLLFVTTSPLSLLLLQVIDRIYSSKFAVTSSFVASFFGFIYKTDIVCRKL